jgi:glycosyl transferase, family 25
LESRKRKKKLAHERVVVGFGYALAPMIQDRCGAAAYVLSPEGAEVLLKRYEDIGAGLTDAFIAHCYDWRAFQLVPAAIVQLDCAEFYGLSTGLTTKTSIANQPKPRTGGWRTRCRYKWRRFACQFLSGVRVMFRRGECIDVGVNNDDFASREKMGEL